jgi:hypothetical protein
MVVLPAAAAERSCRGKDEMVMVLESAPDRHITRINAAILVLKEASTAVLVLMFFHFGRYR